MTPEPNDTGATGWDEFHHAGCDASGTRAEETIPAAPRAARAR